MSMILDISRLRQGYGEPRRLDDGRVKPQESSHPSSVITYPLLVSDHATQNRKSKIEHRKLHIALLTGGGDKPYALGMAAALTSAGVQVEFVGSDDLSAP